MRRSSHLVYLVKLCWQTHTNLFFCCLLKLILSGLLYTHLRREKTGQKKHPACKRALYPRIRKAEPPWETSFLFLASLNDTVETLRTGNYEQDQKLFPQSATWRLPPWGQLVSNWSVWALTPLSIGWNWPRLTWANGWWLQHVTLERQSLDAIGRLLASSSASSAGSHRRKVAVAAASWLADRR